MWTYKNFQDDIDFILFNQKDKTPTWWHKRLFDAYSDLDYDYCWNSGISEEQRFEYIISQMKIQAKKCSDTIQSQIKVFENAWCDVAKQLNAVYSSALDNDCSDILNDIGTWKH